MSSRIHRGFRFAAVALACPFLFLAGALGIHETMYPSGHIAPGPSGVPYYPPDYLVPVVVAVLAFVLYATVRALGWTIHRLLTARRP